MKGDNCISCGKIVEDKGLMCETCYRNIVAQALTQKVQEQLKLKQWIKEKQENESN